jgi:hypothetical protein
MMAAPTRRLAGVPACTSTPAIPKTNRVADHPQAGRSRGRLARSAAAEPESRQQPSSAKPSLKNWIPDNRPRGRIQRLQAVTKSGIGLSVEMAVADAMDSDEESPNGSSRILSSVILPTWDRPWDGHRQQQRQQHGRTAVVYAEL